MLKRLLLTVFVLAAATGCGPQGYLLVDWELEDEVTGVAESCLPGERVEIVVGGYSEEISCNAYTLTTLGLPEGTYTAVFNLYDSADVLVDSLSKTVTIIGGVTTDAGLITFLVP